ncbi:DUF6516 family protein [Pusillimonas sp. SM2304]|uniref:toxin-antitoxin system TumE family protein n=1 Tax=Pusillimonas sp. SM2304 TaxID=3073241 RepID=UPI00287497E1|nr:DUF6516 family protein [Pusillimonas sp. SM2304]MDS1141155.1 DUF6516 family protein [Pusillimonas sp. SM2304]
MSAVLVHRSRIAYKHGFIEMVVWQLPQPIPASPHHYKYRLAYIVQGERVVGYDNERGKGDHKHIGLRQLAYQFTNPEQLIADFLVDIERVEP